MPNPRNNKPTLSDGTGVNYYSLLKFLKDATNDLEAEKKEDAAFYFGQFHEWLSEHYQKNKSFVYDSKVLGL